MWRRLRLRLRSHWRAIALLALFATCVAGCSMSSPFTPPINDPGLHAPPASGDWLEFGFDPARSGVNPSDTALSPANVDKLTKLWQARLPGVADSSPILLHALPFPSGPRDVLYLTTRDGRLVALDASNGAPIWSQQPQGPKITHSSPVADAAHQYVYAYGLDGALHRYDPITGREATGGGWPEPITRMNTTEKEGTALNLANGRIYVATGGYIGDAPPYQGHVVTIDLASGSERVFNSLCSNLTTLLSEGECESQQSGIWSRGGAVVDPVDGDIWVVTGNGNYNANQGGYDYGDSILRLSPDGSTLLDSFTPTNYQALDDTDADLGSSSPALLPRIATSATPLLLAQAGKDGLLRLLNRQNLSGQGGPGHLNGSLQTINLGCGLYTQPAVWTNPADGAIWLFVASGCDLRAFQARTDTSGVTRLAQVWRDGDSVTSPVIAGGMLFAAGSGALRAFDPMTGRTLWSSDQASANGSIGSIHWESPIVVGDAVYIADENGAITCYGLRG